MNQFEPSLVLNVDDSGNRRSLREMVADAKMADSIGNGFIPRDIDGKYTRGNDYCRAAGIIPMEEDEHDLPNLIEESDMEQVIKKCHEEKVFPAYYMSELDCMSADNYSQDGLNFCWAWGITGCFMGTQAMEYGLKNVTPMAAVSLGHSVNWRNAGNYCGEAMRVAATDGIAPLSYVDDMYSRNPSRYKDGWKEKARQYTVREYWDIDCGRGDMYTLRQMLTVLSTGRPIYLAYNWWGHALLGCGLVWDTSAPNNMRVQLWNSHNDGLIELTGRRAVPDEAYGIRSTSLPVAA